MDWRSAQCSPGVLLHASLKGDGRGGGDARPSAGRDGRNRRALGHLRALIRSCPLLRQPVPGRESHRDVHPRLLGEPGSRWTASTTEPITWRVRFMPTELGTWRWITTVQRRGLDRKTGTIECVAPAKPHLHGPLRAQGHHFMHADGTPRFLISTRLSCQFASPRTWPPLVAFLKANRINRVLFMMPGVDSQKSPVSHPAKPVRSRTGLHAVQRGGLPRHRRSSSTPCGRRTSWRRRTSTTIRDARSCGR